jgi:hypothetical protein
MLWLYGTYRERKQRSLAEAFWGAVDREIPIAPVIGIGLSMERGRGNSAK